MYWIKGVLAVALMLCATTALAADKIINVATLSDYPPFCFRKDDTGSHTRERIPPGSDSQILQGYSWDVFRESMHAMGYTIQLHVVPWARTLYYLETGEVDVIFPTGKNAERLEYMRYSNDPINNVDFRVYVRHDDPIEWNGLDSLSGLTIGAVRGWNFGDEWRLRDDIKKYDLSAIPQGFSMLDAKRLDGFLGYEIVWDHTLRELGKSERYKKLPPFGSSAEYVTGMKDNTEAAAMLEDFDAGKRIIADNGTLEAIEQRWR